MNPLKLYWSALDNLNFVQAGSSKQAKNLMKGLITFGLMVGPFWLSSVITANPEEPESAPRVIAVTPTPAPSIELTEAQRYQKVVLSNTEGILAQDLISKLSPETLLSNHQTLVGAVNQGLGAGLPLEDIKQRLADQIQVKQGIDPQLSRNVAGGMIEGALAWDRGER